MVYENKDIYKKQHIPQKKFIELNYTHIFKINNIQLMTFNEVDTRIY